MSARRRQWPWLAGSVLLAAIAVGAPYLERQREFRIKRGPEAARFVAFGQTGRYAGAQWRLQELTKVNLAKLPGQPILPANARVLLISMDVTPDQHLSGESNIGGCSMHLRDGQQRGWRFAPEALSTSIQQLRLPHSCERPRGGPPVGGYPVHALFMVPDDVPLKDLRLELQLFPLPSEFEDEAGQYLDFQLPDGR